MTVDRRVLAGALATLLLVAACGGSASPTPAAATATPAAAATPTATATPTETQEPGTTQEPTSGPDVSFAPGAAGDLERLLPTEAGGVKFAITSFDGASIPGGLPVGEGNDDLAKFLSANGKSLSDVRVALATPTDATAAGSMVMAIQVKGIASDKLLAWVLKDQSGTQKSTVAGKEVYGAGAAGFAAYYYVKNDVAFYVIVTGGTNVADAIISKLP